MNKKQIFYTIVEIIIALMFIQGGFDILSGSDSSPASLPGVFTYLVGQFAIYAYSGIFLTLGVALILGMTYKLNRVHKQALLCMYLVCIYIFALSMAVNGIHWGLLRIAIIGVIVACLWLRWKIKTEYITFKEFNSDLKEL